MDHSYRYLTADDKFLGDDSLPIDVTKDERLNETFGKDSLGKFLYFFSLSLSFFTFFLLFFLFVSFCSD